MPKSTASEPKRSPVLSTAGLSLASFSPRGLRWLESTGPARILHLSASSCTLVDAEDQIASLVTRRVGNGPLNLILNTSCSMDALFGSQATVRRDGSRLRIGHLVLDWHSALVWEPRPDWNRSREAAESWDWLPCLRWFLGRRYSILSSGASEPCRLYRGELADSITDRLTSLGGALFEGLRRKDWAVVAAKVRDLAGLGPGLTPAEDDFLMGILHASWLTLSARQGPEALSAAIVAAVVPRTTFLSSALLQASGEGEASEPLHQLLGALQHADSAALEKAVGRIQGIGHTSGRVALEGFIFGLEALSSACRFL